MMVPDMPLMRAELAQRTIEELLREVCEGGARLVRVASLPFRHSGGVDVRHGLCGGPQPGRLLSSFATHRRPLATAHPTRSTSPVRMVLSY